MIVIQTGLSLSDAERTHPLIGWHNVVTANGIEATTEDADFPASNLANPSTNLFWRGVENSPGDDEYLTITTGNDAIDYIAVQGHNWATADIRPSLEFIDTTNSPTEWAVLVSETALDDDSQLLFRFARQVFTGLRIRLRLLGATAPQAAVIYCGELLVMERSFPVRELHVPLEFGREANVVSGMGESGKFLGRIMIGQHAESVADFEYLTPSWYRANFDPFIVASKTAPFFFAWHPDEYPEEVGYAWLTSSPKPQVDPTTGRMHVSLPMRGVV